MTRDLKAEMDHLTREPIGRLSPDQIAGGTSDERVARIEAKPDEYYRCQRPEVLDLVPRDAKTVLDVGCGAATLGAAIKRRQQAVVHGVEPVAEAAAAAARELDHVWNVPVEAALPLLQDGFYDCIVLADVLEHLVDPWAVLKALKAKLSPNGCVVVSIPNLLHWQVVSQLIEGRFDYTSEGILDRTHLRFFTRRSVEELLWSAGFRIGTMKTTQAKARLPTYFLSLLRSARLDRSALAQDALTYQFLVRGDLPAPASPRVAIVILNWNGKEDTLECLRSVMNLDYGNFEVIVVDNGSSDGSVAEIRAQFPEVAVVETGQNLGYAGGNNVGIKRALAAGAEYVLLLNNDTVVAQDMLRELVDATRRLPDNAVVGCAILFYRDPTQVWFLGGGWDRERINFIHEGSEERFDPALSMVREVDYVTGCALMASRVTLASVGRIDEAFFLTYEDADWCYRARREGYRCFVSTRAKLWHKVSVSFGGEKSALVQYFTARNRLLWARRHLPARERLRLQGRVITKAWRLLFPPVAWTELWPPTPRRLLWVAAGWLRQRQLRLQKPHNRAFLRGVFDYYRGKFGDCPTEVRRMTRR